MITLSQETKEDGWEVENLFDLTFAPGREALSSYRLRDRTAPVASLCTVARNELDIIVGAIRYWPISIGDDRVPCLLLGPIAVHPTTQGEGLGAVLIRETLVAARDQNWHRVMLIGDAPYYERFGFHKATGVVFPPPTNPDRLLWKGLTAGALDGVFGQVYAGNAV